MAERGFSVVTGGSAGIGLELAKCCARDGFDLLIASDDGKLEGAAEELRTFGHNVETLDVDLSTEEGVDELYGAIAGRPVDHLMANAGHGLAGDFLGNDWDELRHVIDTNVIGTLYLIHKVANDMKVRGRGKILITGSIAGFTPGSYAAVYNGSKAFLDNFAAAIANELKDTPITVTNLMPGATETDFFERANLEDTKIGQAKKMDPADVAKMGYEAMMSGDDAVITGWKNKLSVAMQQVMPSSMKAEQHRKEAQPGTGESDKEQAKKEKRERAEAKA